MMRVDMSSEAVAARLREASRLSALAPPCPARVDMTSAGVGRRLREAAQLYELQQHLRSFAPASAHR
jgi:hypothetical protein